MTMWDTVISCAVQKYRNKPYMQHLTSAKDKKRIRGAKAISIQIFSQNQSTVLYWRYFVFLSFQIDCI